MKAGQPLPWGIRDASGRLLLARGFVIARPEQMEALLERGAFVDLDEVQGPRAEILRAPPERLPRLWHHFIERVDTTLHAPPAPDAAAALQELARTLQTLVERSPDLAIFMMVQQDAPARAHYGVTHAVHAAVAALLAARRLTLDEARTQTLLRAALTMNWSMLDLQGRLAHQEQPPTPMQKQQIAGHPDRSVAMLQAAGITDEAWLAAVRDHHERDGGGGYPRGCERPDENARMLHVCDVFAAKFAARAGRAAMPGSSAARSLFAAYPKSDVAAALLKEFGLYPPGCFVELQNGERGVVVYRGSGAHTPVVDVLHGRHGEPTLAPVRRDTAHKGHGIAGPLAPQRITVRVAPEKLFAERSP